MRDNEAEEEELMELISQESKPEQEILRLRRENRALRENLRYIRRMKEQYEMFLNIFLDIFRERYFRIPSEFFESYRNRTKPVQYKFNPEQREYILFKEE